MGMLSNLESKAKIVTDATERNVGRSHAALSVQKNKSRACHVFFAHLVPQPNGAAFAGFTVPVPLGHYTQLSHDIVNMSERPVVFSLLVATKQSKDKGYSYKKTVELAPMSRQVASFSLLDFQLTYRGREILPDFIQDLDLSAIESIGLRITGRAPGGVRQKGFYGLKIHSMTLE